MVITFLTSTIKIIFFTKHMGTNGTKINVNLNALLAKNKYHKI